MTSPEARAARPAQQPAGRPERLDVPQLRTPPQSVRQTPPTVFGTPSPVLPPRTNSRVRFTDSCDGLSEMSHQMSNNPSFATPPRVVPADPTDTLGAGVPRLPTPLMDSEAVADVEQAPGTPPRLLSTGSAPNLSVSQDASFERLSRGGPGGSRASNVSLETDATGASSARQAARDAGITRLRICGTVIRVSFVVWTVVAMAVPMLLLLVATGRRTGRAADAVDVVQRYAPLADMASDCVSGLADEHVSAIVAVVHGVGPDPRVALSDQRDHTDAQCLGRFEAEVVKLLAENAHFRECYAEWTAERRALAVFRDDLNEYLATRDTANESGAASAGANAIAAQTAAAIDSAARAVGECAAAAADLVRTDDTRGLLDAAMAADARESLWAAVAAGYRRSAVVRADNSSTSASDATLVATVSAAYRAARVVILNLEGLASPRLSRKFRTWRSQATTQSLFDGLRALSSSDGNETSTAQALPSPDAFLRTARDALMELRALEARVVEALRSADAAREDRASSAALLAVSVLACAVAAGLLAWHQLRTKWELESHVDRAERTRQAVSAFVPKFFLSKMGYVSINDVQVGESTDVALAMLFSDVRRFSTIAEGLPNAALFEWVQRYFKRMTAVVEAHGGSINQFVGDALFGVFSHPRHSVECAVEMQSDAQQLNIERLCAEQAATPLEIGIGLHYDVLAMGILGDERRHTCTAISASVNLASRLEGLTKQLGCRILASDAVVSQLQLAPRAGNGKEGAAPKPVPGIRRLGPAVVKGSANEVVVFDIFRTDERALQAYKAATCEAFERYAALLLSPGTDPDDAEVRDLERSILDAAEEHGTVDAAIPQMRRVRDPATGFMAFDEK